MNGRVDEQPPTSGNPLSNVARNWVWFWFSPADPTLIGLIRLFVGFLTLWVCLAYTGDLQELFGTNAWVDLQAMQEYRTEMPYPAPSFDWSEPNEAASPSQLNPEEQSYLHAMALILEHCTPKVTTPSQSGIT